MGGDAAAARGAFTFRRLTSEDLEFLCAVRNECAEMLHDNRRFTLEQCREWFDRTQPDFRVILLDGARIGYFRLSHYDADAGSIYIGADLHRSLRGQGLGRAAYQSFMPLLSQELSLRELRLEVLEHNLPALRLYDRLGFREVGRRREVAKRAGRNVDSIIMALKVG